MRSADFLSSVLKPFLLLSCSNLEFSAITAFTNSSAFFFSPSCLLTESEGHSNQSIQSRILLLISCLFSTDLWSLWEKKQNQNSNGALPFILYFFFFLNNKNSLTNEDFFILSISTCIYSWRWNKRPVMSISSPRGSVPTPILPLHPRQAWQESTRAYCCVFDEVYRLFNDWWHTIRKRTSLTFAFRSFSFCSDPHHARPVHIR